jgi:hypothetical protein
VRGPDGVSGVLRALIRPKCLRTCRGCGFTWKVPRYYAITQIGRAQPPNPLLSRRARQSALQRSNEVTKIRAEYDRCPYCGENTFSQRRLWAQSKETYQGVERP